MKRKIGKDEPAFQMFQDYWTLMQNFWETESADEYWEAVVKGIEAFWDKYKDTELNTFAKDISLDYLRYLEDRWKSTRNLKE